MGLDKSAEMESKKCKYCRKIFYRKNFIKNFNRMITCGSENCKNQLKQEWTYNKNCPDCGKIISRNANKCHSCALKGKNNPFYGKTHSEKTKKKLKLFYNGMLSPKKGKTYEEMYGIKKAQELKIKNGLRKKGQKQSKELIRKRLRRRIPSSLESKAIDLINKYNLPYVYVGNGAFFIENKNPDFVNINGKKIAIEVFYRGFKTKKCFQGHDLDVWKRERQKIFNKYGWGILFFDETEVNEKIFVKRLIE